MITLVPYFLPYFIESLLSQGLSLSENYTNNLSALNPQTILLTYSIEDLFVATTAPPSPIAI